MGVLVAVDDLLFTSKIKAAARALDVDVIFARSREDILDTPGARPSLAILDLNHRRLDMVGIIRALKSHPALASVPVVAFVSHVQTQLIEAARAAGAEHVLARLAFTARLGEILESARTRA